jgi:hypothetical protein
LVEACQSHCDLEQSRDLWYKSKINDGVRHLLRASQSRSLHLTQLVKVRPFRNLTFKMLDWNYLHSQGLAIRYNVWNWFTYLRCHDG